MSPTLLRAFHALVPLDGRILVFGGRGGGGHRRGFATDAALLELTPRTEAMGDGCWTHIAIEEHKAVLSRAYAGATVVGGRLLLFGGIDASGVPCADALHVDTSASSLLSITPFSAPVRGGARLLLHGRCFPVRSSVKVRFRWRDSYNQGPSDPLVERTVSGRLHSDQLADCIMPDL